jgi:CHAT domain-containing protein/tetratricopeptide (TPR) repeat protein
MFRGKNAPRDRDRADALWQRGVQRLQQGDGSAIELMLQASEFYEAIGALKEAAECFDALGSLLANAGNLQNAVACHERSLALEQRRGNKPGMAVSLANLGTLFLMMEDVPAALTYQQQACRLFTELGDQHGQALAFFNLGNITSMTDEDAAAGYYEKAVALAEPMGLVSIVFSSLSSLGSLYGRSGNLDRAIPTLEKALTYAGRFRQRGETSLIIEPGGQSDPELALLQNLVTGCLQQEDTPKALRYCTRGLQRARDLRDRYGVALFTGLLGSVHLEAEELGPALRHTEDAVDFFQQAADHQGDLAAFLGQLGRIYHLRGETQWALSYYERALSVAGAVGDPEITRRLKGDLGVLYYDLSQFSQALRYCNEALGLARQSGARASEAKHLANLGLVHKEMRDLPTALETLQAALRIQEEIDDRRGQAIQLGNIGQVEIARGNPHAAIDYFRRALEINVQLGIARGQAIESGNLGMAYLMLGDYPQAMDYLERGVAGSRALGDKYREAIQLAHLGQVHLSLGRSDKALEAWNMAIELAEAVGDPALICPIRFWRGKLLEGYGMVDLACENLQQSIENWELLRLQVPGEGLKLLYVDSKLSEIYESLISLLVEKGGPAHDLYDWVRRAKSQVFADQVHQLDLEPPETVPHPLRDAVRQLRKQAGHLEGVFVRTPSVSTRIQVSVDLAATRRELERIMDEIGRFAPEYAAWRQTRAIGLDQIRSVLDGQGVDVTLVEFFALRDRILLFVTRTGDPDLHLLQAPVPAERLALYSRTCRREIGEYPSLDLEETWQGLGNSLVQPLLPYLDGCELLCLVPHKELHYLPLHALRLDGRRLIESIPAVYLPTSRLLEAWQGPIRPRGHGCLALGYKRSAEEALFEEEAQRVAQLLGGRAYTAGRATSSVIRDGLEDVAYLHISSHGYFDEQDPLASGLELADGRFTVRDVVGLAIDPSLVVLSACDTGQNRLTAGDDLVGFTRSFILAGASSIVVSLWPVHSESTWHFMERLYGHLREGESKAVALQKAQLEVMERYAHPYFWAPFILIGDWR